MQRRDSGYTGEMMLKMEWLGGRKRWRLRERFLDAVKEDMQTVGVIEEDGTDWVKWR